MSGEEEFELLAKDDRDEEAPGITREDDGEQLAVTSQEAAAGFNAFLTYSAALEAVQLGTISLYLPLSLEQYARDNGFLADHTTVCGAAETCQVQLLGIWINSASFSLWSASLGVALQALIAVSLGKYADSSANRRKLLFRTSLTMACAAILCIPLASSSKVWFLITFLNLAISLCHAVSSIAQNASIPIIARQRILATGKRSIEQEGFAKEASRVSARGIAVGYSWGLIFLGLSQIPAQLLKGSTGMRVAIGLSGVQLALFTFGVQYIERHLPGETLKTRLNYKEAWVDLYHLVRKAWQLKETCKYLAYWMIVSDGLATISSAAILYAKTALEMGTGQIIIVGILVPVCSLLSTLIWPNVAAHYKISSHRMLILLTQLTALIPIYACLGFVPFIRNAHSIGSMSNPIEMYLVAAYYGSVHGAFNAYSRATYASLVPIGHEGRFYALYSITGKSTSFLGPLLVGLAGQVTGSLRSGFIIILIGIIGPLPLLIWTDMEKGAEDAAIFAEAEK